MDGRISLALTDRCSAIGAWASLVVLNSLRCYKPCRTEIESSDDTIIGKQSHRE